MASIKVTANVMRDKATTLSACAQSIRQLTQEMMNEINKLPSTWEGTTAETAVRKFQGMSDDFEERFNVINAYSQFLNNAAAEWDRVNATNASMAEALK